jgi:hypothetical protein
MKYPQLLELLICSTIGGYCLMRCVAVMPGVFDELQALLAAAFGRVRDIEAAIEDATE